MTQTPSRSALTARARRYIADAVHAFEHAPVEVSLSVLLAIAFSYTLASDAEPFREWLELTVIAVLAAAVAFVATLLHALGAFDSRTRWALTLAGTLAAALYGIFALDFRFEAEAWRAAALVAAAALLVLGSPALAPGLDATERFRRVTGRLLLRMIGAVLYAGALFAGLALALGAVNTLFELDLDARIYFHTFGWIFIVLVPWVVMGGVPDYVRPAESRSAVAATVHRMAGYLVTPLLAIYYIILYAYAVRIAVTGELPKNLVSPLVIAAGLIAGLALVLFDRPTDDTRSFRSLRAVAPLFVPLAVLGGAAIVMRLDQYGWTEFRGLRLVLLGALAVLALGAVVNVLRRSPLRLHVLPLALAAVLVLSVVGPWSVIAVSRRSQQARLSTALIDAGLDWNATAVRDSVIDSGAFGRIRDTSRYLATHFGGSALPPLLASRLDEPDRFVDVAHAAGLRPEQPDPARPRGGMAQLEPGAAFEDVTGGTLHYVSISRPIDRTGMDADSIDTSYVYPVRVGGRVVTADLREIAREVTVRTGERMLNAQNARVELRDPDGTVRGELFVLEVGFGPSMQLFRLAGIARLHTTDES